jgi:hypothetical protein
MILYSIWLQASYNGNWSCYTYKPGSIWIMQIIKNLYTVACMTLIFFCVGVMYILRWIWRLWCYSECISTPGKLEKYAWPRWESNLRLSFTTDCIRIRIFSWPLTLCKVFGIQIALFLLPEQWWKVGWFLMYWNKSPG